MKWKSRRLVSWSVIHRASLCCTALPFAAIAQNDIPTHVPALAYLPLESNIHVPCQRRSGDNR
eukprot:11582441-Prorocentrum_lima.AAC.1